MKSTFKFVLMEQPEQAELDRVGQNPMVTFMISGIINPFGPSMTAYYCDGIPQPDCSPDLMKITLNPFAQSLEKIGRVVLGDDLDPVQAILPVFKHNDGSCPSVLLHSALFDPNAAKDICAQYLAAFADGYSVLEDMRRCPGKPWERLSGASDLLKSLMEKIEVETDHCPETQRSLRPGEAEELADLLLDPQLRDEELKAFLAAWDGAIAFQESAGLAQEAMPLDPFFEIFLLLVKTCAYPSAEGEDGEEKALE